MWPVGDMLPCDFLLAFWAILASTFEYEMNLRVSSLPVMASFLSLEMALLVLENQGWSRASLIVNR